MKKRLHHLIYILIFFLFSMVAGAQVSVIKGKILDEKTTDPLPFVNIGVKGQSAGTFSDSNGAFRL